MAVFLLACCGTNKPHDDRCDLSAGGIALRIEENAIPIVGPLYQALGNRPGERLHGIAADIAPIGILIQISTR